MENGTKALLITASVLISIVLIATGVLIVKSGLSSHKQVGVIGNKISSTTQGIVGDIESSLNDKNTPKFAIANMAIKHTENAKLNITGVPKEELGDVKYSSSDTDVATVDDTGKVIGVGTGEATITATYKDFMSACTVTVEPKVTTITITNSPIYLEVGDTATILVKTSPTQVVESLNFFPINHGIVTIESSGWMEAIGAGTTEVIVSYGNIRETCYIYVTGGFYEGP